MKGQVPVLESVMLFAIGVAIFVLCFTAFTIYQSGWTAQAEGEQLEQVGLYISGFIETLTEGTGNSSVKINLPKQVGSSFYNITFDDQLKQLNMTSQISSHFFRLNTDFNFSGKVSSGAGRILLKREGNNIIII